MAAYNGKVSKGRRNIFILLLVLGLLIASALVIISKPTKLGLDLKGGVELTYQGEPTPQSKVTPDAIKRAIEIIRERVDAFGIAEPEIQQSGRDQITVSLPDVKSADKAARQVGKTAQLYFYDWQRNVTGDPEKPITGLYNAVKQASKYPARTYGTSKDIYYLFNKKTKQPISVPDTSEKGLLEEYDGKMPKDGVILKVNQGTLVVRNEKQDKAKKKPDQWYIIKDRPELSGTEIKKPQGILDPQSQQPVVSFSFTGDGQEKFAKITKRIAERGAQNQLPGQPAEASSHNFAVILDRELISRPIINFEEFPEGIDDNGAQIEGSFTMESAQDLARLLQIGALPINLKLISETQVSATLGKQALNQALIAGLIGLVLVMIYLISFYRLLGVISVIALIVYAAFFYAVAKLIPITMTLPGIAGLVLTIGVAADANIVIFERIKEEYRAGKSVPSAIAAGYSKGFKTIVDANAVTFITAFILFMLATAGVKGFAYVLGIGIIMSMFTAVFATQAVLTSMSHTRVLASPAMLGAGERHLRWHFDFMGASRWFFSMSGVILAAGAIAFATKGINAGLDFKGGTRAVASLDKPANETQLRQALAGLKLKDLKIQRIQSKELGNNVVQISTKELGVNQVGKMQDALDNKFGVVANGFSSESVGPTFGDQVKKSALYAIIFSLLAVAVYLTWRFQFKFAVPAMIALVHDLLIAFGVYSMTGKTVTTATVAALLTILGYSLYDTVIVFDRVRENVPRMPGAAFSQIVNRSMSEVLTRSLNTSVSTLLPVAVILVLGGETLKDFAFALLVGIASGTYSSIFIASPVLTAWKEREQLYVSRRAQIAAQFGGVVPAFADMTTSASLTVAQKAKASEDVGPAVVDGAVEHEEGPVEPEVPEKSTSSSTLPAARVVTPDSHREEKDKRFKQSRKRRKHGRR